MFNVSSYPPAAPPSDAHSMRRGGARKEAADRVRLLVAGIPVAIKDLAHAQAG